MVECGSVEGKTFPCSMCRELKSPLEFYSDKSRSTGIASRCKECNRIQSREWAKNNRGKANAWGRTSQKRIKDRNHANLFALLSGSSCVDCGISDPLVLEFHHLRDKSYNVAQILHWSWERILLEIDKCIILCANCHRVRTIKESSHWRWNYVNKALDG
jgi:hypothetical protein